MTKFSLLRTLAIAALLSVIGLAGAQEPGTAFKVAYINSDYLLTLHPNYPEIVALQEQAAEDAGTLNQKIQDLLAKRQAGQELTTDEQDVLSVSMITLDSLTARYDADIRVLLQPAIDEITQAVAQTAEALGLAMVFDYRPARESGIIVYADPLTDITELVATRLGTSE